MPHEKLDSYLRMHRRRTGLSQEALSAVLGLSKGQVSRHERMQVIPPLQAAFGYEVVFQVPIPELFAGVQETARTDVEEKLLRLQHELQQTSGKGQQAEATARILEWLQERRSK